MTRTLRLVYLKVKDLDVALMGSVLFLSKSSGGKQIVRFWFPWKMSPVEKKQLLFLLSVRKCQKRQSESQTDVFKCLVLFD